MGTSQVVGVVVPRSVGDVLSVQHIEPRSEQSLCLVNRHVGGNKRLHAEIVIGRPGIIGTELKGRCAEVVVAVGTGIDKALKVVQVRLDTLPKGVGARGVFDGEVKGHRCCRQLGQCLDCQRSDDADGAAATTTEHPENIRVLRGCGRDETAIGKYHYKAS